MHENRSKNLLLNLGLISEENIQSIADKVRDRDDVRVLRDKKSGVIFLDRTDHITDEYYASMDTFKYWNAETLAEALKKYGSDDIRRSEQFASYLKSKDVIDVGCGTGGFLKHIQPIASKIAGIEPQEHTKNILLEKGYAVYSYVKDAPQKSFDTVTLFHVLEHIVDPLDFLQEVHKLLKPNGQIIIEVPHARDALLELASFRNFSFWSEHLILHTKQSLEKILIEAGFKISEVYGYQRYSLANHLGWLATGLPGGQNEYPALESDESREMYKKLLEKEDKTDTLIAIARV